MPLQLSQRPKLLKHFAGNEETKEIVKGFLKREEDKPRAFLIHGPSGCGKTTLARILASKLGASGRDIRELNTADFRGVETAREVRSQLVFKPFFSEVVVWIMDEVHGLTGIAQDAMLKFLEDTPDHAYFILCTTDPQKLKIAFKRRCSPLEVVALEEEEVYSYMKGVCKKVKKEIPKSVLQMIARDSLGSVGMALMVLDAVIDLDPKAMKKAAKRAAVENSETIELCRALFKGSPWSDVARILRGLQVEPESMRRQVLGYMNSIALKGNTKLAKRACGIMECFEDNYYDTGKAGLVVSCVRVCGL